MTVLGALGCVQQAPGICVDKFGEVDTTSGRMEEWTRHQVMCYSGDSLGRVRLALDLGKLVKLIFIRTRRVVVCEAKGRTCCL